jgi:hypothetical protein
VRIDTPQRLALIAFVFSLILLAATTTGMPVVWDEAEYLSRADRILEWLRLFADHTSQDGGRHALSARAIREHWMFMTTSEGHPAWGVIPMAAAKALLSGLLGPLTAARFATVAIFSAACGAVAFRVRAVYGMTAAIVAVVALLSFPRIFAEAHFATLDGQLTAWWLLLWAADTSLRSDVRSTIGIGILAGLTSATKFTGWLVWMPLAATRILRPDRRQRLALLLIVPIGMVAFWAVNPPLWHRPLRGLVTHFRLNLDRANTFNIAVEFLGRSYDMVHPLPWYNTIVWLLIVTPLPLLVLGGIGLAHCLRARDAVSVSLLFHWATLMVVRALPGAPPHDGIRLFLPAFGFWAVLAGIGAQRVWERSRRYVPAWRGSLIRAVVVGGLAAGAVNLARYYPQTLSHYNLLIGGVRGATAMGMEPTYWWDSLDDDVLGWLNQHTGEAVAFSRAGRLSVLTEWNRLHVPIVDSAGVFKWYVVQNRTGLLNETDRVLIRTATPAYTKFAGRRRPGSAVPPDLKVPLLLIYTFEDFKTAKASAERRQ